MNILSLLAHSSVELLCCSLPIGFLISLPFGFHAVRKATQAHYWRRIGAALLIAATATLLALGLDVLLFVNFEIVEMADLYTNPDFMGKVSLEAWSESVVPPQLRPDCFSDKQAICQYAQYYSLHLWDFSSVHLQSWSNYSPYSKKPLVVAILAGLVSVISMWFFLQWPKDRDWRSRSSREMG